MTNDDRLRLLAERMPAARAAVLSDAIAPEAIRSLRNICATAIGGLETPGVLTVRRHFEATAPGAIHLLGTDSTFSGHAAAVICGLSAHMDDFDDTHVASSVHSSAASFAATLTAAQMDGANAADFFAAFALGCEFQLRIGRAMMPWHYERGWHITGTVGSLGAAVAAGIVRGLDADTLAQAIALACSQSLGLREAFGTSGKPFHPGKAAANGLLAVELARAGVKGSPDALFGPAGYFAVLSDTVVADRVLDGFGETWLLAENTYKPYPCGLVIHPLIDLGIEFREKGVTAEAIDRITVSSHPIVRELTGNPTPVTPLEARFSGVHGLAMGLVFGKAGVEEFDVAGLSHRDIPQVRQKIDLVDDESVGWTGCFGTARLTNGDEITVKVPVARGSVARPLSDAELQDKFRSQVSGRLHDRTDALWTLLGDPAGTGNIGALIAAATPV
ncbi:MmgE/PrpD family protein [Fodinicurvata sp. EGI_FJ10296]|uniref:MmgE/PrpD family protein n=1 Tax=Fodinicurvata sp. EGI_FJ10296 TaxID=3231908 RepID=UPI003456B575